MRPFLLLLFWACLTSCDTWNSLTNKDRTDEPAVVTTTPDLEAPPYDPSDSPAVMTADDPLPVPERDRYPEEEVVAYSSAAPATPQPYGRDVQARGAEATALSPAAAEAAPLLTGDWVNNSDEREIVRFSPTHYYTFYDGELLVEEDMTFYGDCPAECMGGEMQPEFRCFTISGPAGTDCYGVVRLTENVLELSMLGVSTETIVYTKLP